MGTNFYWKTETNVLPTGETVDDDRMNPAIHIGKRSAAGWYCWDCNLTLCIGGEAGIHNNAGMHDKCPQCGGEKIKEGLKGGPVAVELGFAKPNRIKPTGVRGCSSFSWAQDGDRVVQICEQNLESKLIVDEYGDEYSCNEFLGMLHSNCPVRFTHSIGTWFC